MKIAVVNTWRPFVRGGAEILADALTERLNEYGHETLLVRIPFEWDPPEKIVDHMFACRSLRLEGVDRMIGLKFPSYYMPHPNKVLWLLHQFRQAYDLWDTDFQGLSGAEEGQLIRDAVRNADNLLLPDFRKIYTISSVTGDRLRRFNGLESDILLHPLARESDFHCTAYGDFVFCPSRINEGKRQFVLVQAMRYVRSDVRLVLAGIPETSQDLKRITDYIGTHQLHDRVQLLPRYIDEQEKVDLFASALACAYVPFDEDSYGYVSLEAFKSRKPVVTFADSGGVLTLVEDGVTGRVCDPDPEACAAVFDELWLARDEARRLGQNGFDKVQSLNISWDRVVQALTS